MYSKVKYNITKAGIYEAVLLPGIYYIECWGAQGGIGLRQSAKVTEGGKGAYVSGVLSVHTKQQLFLFVGGQGKDGSNETNTHAEGGFNGGGIAGADTRDDEGSGGGGGATDVRLINSSDDAPSSTKLKSIYSRIIVAAGGSGSAYGGYGAPGGDLTGYISGSFGNTSFYHSTTNQTNGYKLGVGEDGKDDECTPSSGSGGGYWGGIASDPSCEKEYVSVSSSGSSFVSGYPGCKAVDSNGSTLDHPNHYSGIIFISPIIKSGLEIFKSPYGGDELGHSGDGAIIITMIGYIHKTNKQIMNYRASVFFLIALCKSNK